MMQDRGFKRKSKASSDIPSSSLADMAFLLLIFFMVSTTFRKEQPRDVEVPEAAATQKLDTPRKHILHIYVEPDGSIYINDRVVPPEALGAYVRPLYEDSDRRLVMVLRADREVPYSVINQVQLQLQSANATHLTYYTNLEQRVRRERR
ncbi:MAG TPA: biopolymer transporter ExbD [Longimicrobiales bacterium]|nr:biopolymer transporter ExbD [Longimicrobiales bacterium]